MVKSASSFATQIVYGLLKRQAQGIGGEMRVLADYVKRPRGISLAESLFVFDAEPIDEIVEGILQKLDESRGDVLILKLHRACTPYLASLIRDRRIRAISTYRDPRDVALSLLDAARRDAEMGRTRFTQYASLEDTIGAVEYQIGCLRSWAEVANVQLISFEELRCIPYSASVRIARHLGCNPAQAVVSTLIENPASIWEFNKGESGRWRDERVWDDQSAWRDALKQYAEIVARATLLRSIHT